MSSSVPIPPTHTAFTFRREGRRQRFGRWIEIGVARSDEDTGAVRVFLDRLPVGGFSGHIYLAPRGTEPPPPTPQRPGESGDEDED